MYMIQAGLALVLSETPSRASFACPQFFSLSKAYRASAKRSPSDCACAHRGTATITQTLTKASLMVDPSWKLNDICGHKQQLRRSTGPLEHSAPAPLEPVTTPQARASSREPDTARLRHSGTHR